MANRLSQYKVFPLPVVQKWARKRLSVIQLREGIKLARRLRFYPDVPIYISNHVAMEWNSASSVLQSGRQAGYALSSGSTRKQKRFISSISSGKSKTPFPLRTACVPTNGFGIKASARSRPQTVALITSTRSHRHQVP